MDELDRLRLEYETASARLRELTEIRFKLLALVPTLAGTAVAFVGRGQTPAAELLAVGVLGLVATGGVLLYELRNGRAAALVERRAGELEDTLLPHGRLLPAEGAGPRLLGLALPSRGLAVALVYGAALAGWCYLVAWGALAEVGVDHARTVGVVLAGIAGLALVAEVERLERSVEAPAPSAATRSA